MINSLVPRCPCFCNGRVEFSYSYFFSSFPSDIVTPVPFECWGARFRSFLFCCVILSTLMLLFFSVLLLRRTVPYAWMLRRGGPGERLWTIETRRTCKNIISDSIETRQTQKKENRSRARRSWTVAVENKRNIRLIHRPFCILWLVGVVRNVDSLPFLFFFSLVAPLQETSKVFLLRLSFSCWFISDDSGIILDLRRDV